MRSKSYSCFESYVKSHHCRSQERVAFSILWSLDDKITSGQILRNNGGEFDQVSCVDHLLATELLGVENFMCEDLGA